MSQDARELARAIRLDALDMTRRGKSSHIGSVMGMADILAALYANVLSYRPQEPRWPGRDRVILSKGHAGAGMYAVLAESGFFPVETLQRHCEDGSTLSGHVSHRGVPGVELSTGSLGHGLGVATGMALAAQLDQAPHRVFCIMSDGECDEGSVWEAVLFAAHHKLGNLTAVIDYNKIQSLAPVAETLALEPFRAKWEAFGWEVEEVDGHDLAALTAALGQPGGTAPRVVIAHTTKGRGVSFMENSVLWHYRSPQGEEFEAARQELMAR
ncbi:MAG: transketolase [Candidatus Nanopelagicales bacterium]